MASRSSVAANTAKARKMAGKEASWNRLLDSAFEIRHDKYRNYATTGQVCPTVTVSEEIFRKDWKKYFGRESK